MTGKKIAVVTGANRGLGLETSKQLAAHNYSVVLATRDLSKGTPIAAELNRQGYDAYAMELDVSNTDSISTFSSEILRKHTRVDVLVNNAGIMIDDEADSDDISKLAKVIERTFRTNTMGAYLLCRALIPQMIQNGYGRVVNVSSGMGQLSDMNKGYPGYRISKTALNAVTKIFADETNGTNVLVNSVCPGWVQTDMGGKEADRSVEKGVETIVWLATLADGSSSGGFFRDRKPISW